MVTVGKLVLKLTRRRLEKNQMTDELLQLIEQRKMWKNGGEIQMEKLVD